MGCHAVDGTQSNANWFNLPNSTIVRGIQLSEHPTSSDPSDLNALKAVNYNLRTSREWDRYRHHRRQVMRLLVDAASQLGHLFTATPRLLVIGAGNCNDLELKICLNHFSEVHLVDIDNVAVGTGVDRQFRKPDSRIRIHGEVDLLKTHQLPCPAAQTVLSACVLSQLIDTVAQHDSTASQAEALAVQIQRLRQNHLQLLTRHCEPNGRIILITDFVSSDTVPELGQRTDEQLASLAVSWLQEGNFFTGLNPFAIKQAWQDDTTLSPLLAGIRIEKPWKWQIGDRYFAVTAILATRNEKRVAPTLVNND